jgi:VCBS repeat-containing protein
VDVTDESPALSTLIVSEVSPWSSGNTAFAADWFEVTNLGDMPVDITGWKVDDNSNAVSNAVALRGVSSIAPGQSAVFIESDAAGTGDIALISAFATAWFGSATLPAGFLMGAYGGSGVGLSTGGDAVNLFDSAGNRVTGISFGVSTTGFTFDNAAAAGSPTLPLPAVSTLSVAGINGAFVAADGAGTGSPGTIAARARITEVSPWSSGNTDYAADWFEITNIGNTPVDLTGWKMDDNSNAFANAVALRSVTVIPAGKSAVFFEGEGSGSTDPLIAANFAAAWFGAAGLPAGFLLGAYSGSGVGLSTGGDAVNLFDAAGKRITGVSFGASTTGFTFDNAAGAGSEALPLPAISSLSIAGVNGAFLAADGMETGSPGTIEPNIPPVAGADSVATDEDTLVAFNVLQNDSDADGDILSVTGFTAPVHGTLVSNGDGSFTYTAGENFNGDDSFTYSITDGKGGNATGTVAISIAPVNDAPIVVTPGPQTTAEDVGIQVNGISVNDVDAAEGAGEIEVVLSVASGRLKVSDLVEGGVHGAQIQGNGTSRVVLRGPTAAVQATLAGGVGYTGKINFHGVDTLLVTANDLGHTGQGGALSGNGAIAIRVLSAAEQIAGLIDTVQEYYAEGLINRRVSLLLLRTLGLAQTATYFGLPKVAYAAIGIFRHEVGLFLSPALAQPLLVLTKPLLTSLEVGSSRRW